MDEPTKKEWKWKFYWLAVQLNAIILLVAVAVLSFFLVPGSFRLPIVLVALLLAVIVTLLFRRNYAKAKAWLEVHGNKKEVREPEETS